MNWTGTVSVSRCRDVDAFVAGVQGGDGNME